MAVLVRTEKETGSERFSAEKEKCFAPLARYRVPMGFEIENVIFARN